MLRRTVPTAAGVVLLLLGAVAASGRSSAADPYVGTWSVRNSPGFTYDSPWKNGGTVAVTSSTRATVASYKGDPGWGGTQDVITPECLGYPNEPNPPAVSAWYLMTYSWGGTQGTMAGCVSDRTRGFAHVFGPGTYAELHGGASACTPSPCFIGYWTDQPGPTTQFLATPASPQTTETVNEPAPGQSTIIQSPNLPVDCTGSPVKAPTKTCSRDVNVSSSSGNLGGTTVAGVDDATQFQANLVVWCWLAYDFTDENGAIVNLSAQEQLALCSLVVKKALRDALKPPARTAAKEPTARPTTRTAAGCRTKSIAIAVRRHKGKIVKIGPAKQAKLRASSVRYSCSASGGAAKITISGPRNMRKLSGKKLVLAVSRAKKAPKQSAKLTFTFGW